LKAFGGGLMNFIAPSKNKCLLQWGYAATFSTTADVAEVENNHWIQG
jgi:hypothetical protein